MPAGAPLVGSPAIPDARTPTEAGLHADCLAAATCAVLGVSSRLVTGRSSAKVCVSRWRALAAGMRRGRIPALQAIDRASN